MENIKDVFGFKLKNQLILLFSLFLLLFMGSITLFGIIYASHTIWTNFYLYLQYFQQKNFSFSKISRSQTNPKCTFGSKLKCEFILLFSLFLLLFMSPVHFLVLFMGLTILFQLTFTFIYNTFSKKFLISAK